MHVINKTLLLSVILCSILLAWMSCEPDSDKDPQTEDPEDTLSHTGNPFDSILVVWHQEPEEPECACVIDSAYDPHFSTAEEEVYQNLLACYENKSQNCLEYFLDTWYENIGPIDTTGLNDTIKNIYQLYTEFYSPWDLSRTGGSEWGDNLYTGVPYYIIQNEIGFNFSLEEGGYSGEQTLTDFRPTIANQAVKILYLTDFYSRILNYFIGTEHINYECYGVPMAPCSESYNRVSFLNQYLRIAAGHWGNSWHILTHPEVFSISFNPEMDSARVDFRIIYQGGEAILIKQQEGWELVDAYLTWIE